MYCNAVSKSGMFLILQCEYILYVFTCIFAYLCGQLNNNNDIGYLINLLCFGISQMCRLLYNTEHMWSLYLLNSLLIIQSIICSKYANKRTIVDIELWFLALSMVYTYFKIIVMTWLKLKRERWIISVVHIWNNCSFLRSFWT